MKIVFLEFKRYLQDYKKILAAALSGLIICGLVLSVAQSAVERNSLFEPFVVGFVNNDKSPYTAMLFDAFNSAKGLNESVTLEEMTMETAEQKLAEGDIPAFLIIPGNFAHSVRTLKNSPFTLVGTLERPLGLALSRLLSSAAVSFLTTAQSGIMATSGFCQDNGLTYQQVNDKVIMPINYEYGKKLLNYNSFFHAEVVNATGELPISTHYLYSAIIFFLSISMMVFAGTIKQGTAVVSYQRYRLAGLGLVKQSAVQVLGLFLMTLLITCPLSMFFGLRVIAIVLCLSCFTYMTASIVESEAQCGLLLFIFSLISMFLSGGILPAAFLPPQISALKYLTVNYWAINTSAESTLVLVGFSLLFFGLSMLRKRTC